MNKFLERYEELKETSNAISMEKIGDLVGKEKSTIHYILNEKRGTFLDLAVKIGKALGMTEKDSIEAWKEMEYKRIDLSIEKYKKTKKR